MQKRSGIIKFQVAGINFGIYADRILEIVQYQGVRRSPQPFPYVIGMMELRNYVVVVVDFRKRLSLPSLPLSKNSTMIVTKLGLGMFGILVDSLSDFRQVSPDMLLPPISVAGFPEQLLLGVLADQDDIMLLPDFDKIFSSYISIRLVPITPSEKIAFQYRFTPGALTRTLEYTLLTQQYLEKKVVRKLSQSMCLPSVIVHKVTSYYSDFHPRVERRQHGDEFQPPSSQKTRAGDATYLSLSEQLQSEQQEQRIHAQIREQHSEENHFEASMLELPPDPPPKFLENILLMIERYRKAKRDRNDSIETMLQDTGLRMARKFQIPPARLAKYFTFHGAHVSSEREEGPSSWVRDSPQDLMPSPDVPTRLEALWKEGYPIEEVLQRLNREEIELHEEDIQHLCRLYQTTPVKVARLLLYFPALSYRRLADEGPEALTNDENRTAQHKEPEHDTIDYASRLDAALSSMHSSFILSECLTLLADNGLLEDDEALRYVASRMHRPACSLSKLRSYYLYGACEV